MKAVLVVEMPESCNKCKCNFDHWCSFDNFERHIDDLEQKPKWCSLRPMPTKKVALFDPNRTDEDEARRFVWEVEGYNRCVDEIEGKEND